MAGPTIDQAFITKFEKDLHLTYRQMASKLRGLVRTDAQVNGSTARFYKLGTLVATAKSRNGEIPSQNPDHSYATATMVDRYISLYADQLDLTKLDVDLKSGYLRAGAAAFGVETDDQIIQALTGATTNFGGYSGNWSQNNALIACRYFDINNVPDDGRRFAAVTPYGWAHLMTIDEFIRSDYVGPDDLPYKKMGMEVRTWLGINWIKHTRLPGSGTTQAKSYLWHMDAVGHGINAEVQTNWEWKNERWAWNMAGAMSMGATVIDATGVFEARWNDETALS